MKNSDIRARRAEPRDFDAIMALIHRAQAYIKTLGIEQWQDGYPEPELIRADIEAGRGWVFDDDGGIAGYTVLMPGREPIYDRIDGRWRTGGDRYVTVHRMAIDDGRRGTGLSVRMLDFAEAFARAQGLASVRIDTHRGNVAMRGLLKKAGYAYCGEVVYVVNAGDPIRVCYEKLTGEAER